MAQTDIESARNSSDQKKPERPNFWLVIAILAGSGLLLTAIFGGHGLMRWLQADQEKKRLTAELEKVEGQNSVMRREIVSLRHNGKYIETIARRDLGMVKSDEIIYQFLPNKKTPETLPPLPTEP